MKPPGDPEHPREHARSVTVNAAVIGALIGALVFVAVTLLSALLGKIGTGQVVGVILVALGAGVIGGVLGRRRAGQDRNERLVATLGGATLSVVVSSLLCAGGFVGWNAWMSGPTQDHKKAVLASCPTATPTIAPSAGATAVAATSSPTHVVQATPGHTVPSLFPSIPVGPVVTTPEPLARDPELIGDYYPVAFCQKPPTMLLAGKLSAAVGPAATTTASEHALVVELAPSGLTCPADNILPSANGDYFFQFVSTDHDYFVAVENVSPTGVMLYAGEYLGPPEGTGCVGRHAPSPDQSLARP